MNTDGKVLVNLHPYLAHAVAAAQGVEEHGAAVHFLLRSAPAMALTSDSTSGLAATAAGWGGGGSPAT